MAGIVGVIIAISLGLAAITGIICLTIYELKVLSKQCKHQWKTVRDYTLSRAGVTISNRYIQQCVHCGKVQNVDCYADQYKM